MHIRANFKAYRRQLGFKGCLNLLDGSESFQMIYNLIRALAFVPKNKVESIYTQVEKERNDQLTGIVTGDTVPEDLLKIELSEQTPGEAGEGLNMMKEGSPAKSVASSVQHSNR